MWERFFAIGRSVVFLAALCGALWIAALYTQNGRYQLIKDDRLDFRILDTRSGMVTFHWLSRSKKLSYDTSTGIIERPHYIRKPEQVEAARLMGDPAFRALPVPEQIYHLSAIDGEFAGLPPLQQLKVLDRVQPRKWWQWGPHHRFRPIHAPPGFEWQTEAEAKAKDRVEN